MNFFKNISQKLWGGSSFSELILSGAYSDSIILSTYNSVLYYTTVAPVYTAVELLSNEFASITPIIKINGEVKENHPLGKLLEHPNADLTYSEFAKQLAAWFVLTGNAFISANAMSEKKEPNELEIIQPQDVTAILSSEDRYIYSYSVSETNSALNFEREEIKKRFRFYDREKEHELWHIKTFNPNRSSLFGLSKLNATYYEIEQYIESSKHNLSLLKNGITSSGVLWSEEALNDDQRQRLKATLNSRNTGSDNAGRIFLFDGGKFDFKDMSKSMKDMDFKELKRDIVYTLYNSLNIPLPLISAEHMTMSNYEEAKFALYDNAIIPLAKRLFEELTVFLALRYKEEGLEITFDDSEIPTLRARANIEKERLRIAGILTPNESRDLDSYKPIANGDELYQPNNLLPIGQLDDVEDTQKQKFIEIMKKQTNNLGNRKYTDDEIEKSWCKKDEN